MLYAFCHGRSVATITGSNPSRMMSAGVVSYGLPPVAAIRPYAAWISTSPDAIGGTMITAATLPMPRATSRFSRGAQPRFNAVSTCCTPTAPTTIAASTGSVAAQLPGCASNQYDGSHGFRFGSVSTTTDGPSRPVNTINP